MPADTKAPEYAVTVENLEKRFGSFQAVNKVSFQVRRGEIFGFLGPNGAGKSTTIIWEVKIGYFDRLWTGLILSWSS